GHDDQVQVGGIQAGFLQRPAGRHHRQVRGGLVLGRYPALADAGPGADPLVGGVHHLLQVEICDHAFRDARTHPGDGGAPAPHSFNTLPAAVRWSAMRSTIRCWPVRTATPMPLATARASELPWHLMTTLLRPSSGAPPYSA